jgi:fructose transport system permease protein
LSLSDGRSLPSDAVVWCTQAAAPAWLAASGLACDAAGCVRVGDTPIAYGAVAMLLLYALAFVVLRDTAAGRHVYAVGNNLESARLAGISTNRLLLRVYMLSGLCAGVAALLSIARTGVGDPQSGQTENLDTVTAVVLGGTSLFGGRGIVLGSLVGALIVGVFRNGLTLMGVSSVYQILVTGVLVILAVATDQWSRRS